jgi:uncharacterized membrane protein YuzA (DUF378 family)
MTFYEIMMYIILGLSGLYIIWDRIFKKTPEVVNQRFNE